MDLENQSSKQKSPGTEINLEKLFEAQKVLRDHIGYNQQDRFHKLILALLVELGECANEWRGFKFWSKDQQPRVRKAKAPYMDLDDADFYNPLLEEFVDGLHFVLEIGIEIESTDYKYQPDSVKCEHIENQFLYVYELTTMMLSDNYYFELFDAYINLGKMLGFTWEEIGQAYFAKNKVNHERQNNNY